MALFTFEHLHKNGTVPSDIAGKIETLAEFKGRQDLYARTKPESLYILRETVISQSTAASNAIEGIEIPPERLEALLARRVVPRDRPEEEIAGYRDVLWVIDGIADPARVSVTPDFILELHRDLYRYTNVATAGRWKSKDNVIEARTSGGKSLGVIFRPPAAAVTPRFMEELCEHLARAREEPALPSPIIVAAFALDLLCIHPFDDGNGRMARLLTHLLLLQEGYVVGRYVPLERLIYEAKNAYYAALRASTTGWYDATHDPYHWTRYLLDTLIRAYREMEQRVSALAAAQDPRAKLIRDAALSRRRFSISELRAALPKVSRAYIFRVVKELVDEGRLRRTERGQYALPMFAEKTVRSKRG